MSLNAMNHQHFSHQRNKIPRTLANSHPLMSPGTDSDSENSHGANQNASKNKQIQAYSFPDVVPASEHKHINNKVASTTPQHNYKLTMLRAHSLDLISSESEADISQFHATVEINFQAVTLTSNTTNTVVNGKLSVPKYLDQKNMCEDISSLDSISNHSFDKDEDIEHNLASLSPSSSLADGIDDNCNAGNGVDDGSDLFVDQNASEHDLRKGINAVPLNPMTKPTDAKVDVAMHGNSITSSSTLPQYSATEEHRNSRNWQKVTLPDGRLFEIDMRVIEPYKRVLSHGGYLNTGGHNAIVIFCACHLPDRSRADYNYVMDNLFLYVVKTLEQLVTDDYVLIYLHGGCNRSNVPPFPWLKKCYQLLDRRLRKSLKNMYIVHPTFWVKSIVWMARPFVSVKFWRKLIYVNSLEDLDKHVLVEKAAIPEKVKQYDAKHN